MSLTVKDCLNLPSMSFCNVIAGEQGLDKIVSSVSVLEFIDENKDNLYTFSPNELTISAFYMIKDNIDKQCETLKDLSETGSVGLVLFYTGYVLKEISPLLIQTANNLNFPLITISTGECNINYSNIISDITNAIFKDQSTTEKAVTSIMKRLSQIPIENRSMENLLKVVSNHYKCNLILSTHSNIFFAAEYQPAQKFSNEDFILSTFQNDSLHYSHKKIIVEGVPLSLYKMDFLHTNNLWMTVYASCFNTELTEETMNNICYCTNYFSTLWGYSLDFQSKDVLISLILKAERETTLKFLEQQNIEFASFSDIIIIDSENSKLSHIQKDIKQILFDAKKNFISDIIDNHLIILTSLLPSSSINDLLIDDINNYVAHLDYKSSTFIHSGSNNIAHLKSIYFDYCKAVLSLQRIFINKRKWDIFDVALAKEITELSEFNSQKTESILQIINSLDHAGDNLLETLATYFIDCDSHLNQTAKQLSIHRNTLAYRMNKIKEITNADFTLMPASYHYYVASALWRFMNSKKI